MAAYHEGQRALQDRFDTRRLADRLEQVTYHQEFSESDRTFIESARFFMLATVDDEGRPDVSYKGGVPGFVRCVSDAALEFPTYDGNGQFRSLGNILVMPFESLSPHAPRYGYEPPDPEWKQHFTDVLPCTPAP